MFVFRAFLLLATCLLSLSEADTTPSVVPSPAPSAKTEKALRGQIARFYTLMIERKFREAELLVAPASRDDYYVGEKPLIKDFKVEAIRWEPGFKEASVSMVSLSVVRRAMVGQFDVSVPYLSHWTFEREQWWWFAPKRDVRSTPFGDMKIDPRAAASRPPDMDLKKMIASGPEPESIVNGVQVSAATVDSVQEAKVTVENTMSIPVTVKTRVFDGGGFTVALDSEKIEPHGKSVLTISRIPGETFFHGRALLLVEQTGQAIEIQVQ